MTKRTMLALFLTLAGCGEVRTACPIPDAGPVLGDAAELPAPGRVSSRFACNVLAAAYFEAEGLGAYTCDGISLPPACPWPSSLTGGSCPYMLDGECVREVCDPAAVTRCYVAASAANTCDQYLAALVACDREACR